MNAITELFSRLSGESIFLFIVLVCISIKYLIELVEWFYSKLKIYFTGIDDSKVEKEELYSSVRDINQRIKNMDRKIDNLQEKIEIIQDYLQDTTRAYLIDRHHYFIYVMGAIDDISLQDIERRYLYYKANGGNSFIDILIDEIRQLPRVTVEKLKIIMQKKALKETKNQDDDA